MQDPKLFGVEWVDGAPPSLYLSSARDEVLAAILDAAQVLLHWHAAKFLLISFRYCCFRSIDRQDKERVQGLEATPWTLLKS